jgi:hypothetical protein
MPTKLSEVTISDLRIAQQARLLDLRLSRGSVSRLLLFEYGNGRYELSSSFYYL